MDFKNALRQTSTTERDRLIENEVTDEDWCDYLTEDMQHGGWPDEADVETIKIVDKGGEEIIVNVDVAFSESVSTGCKDVNFSHNGSASFRIRIDRETGLIEVEAVGADVDDDFVVYSGDYY